jgi:AAA domain-containing protein
VPLGKISGLEGDPGLGKSTTALDVGARVTTGRPMPDGTPGSRGGVLLLTAEDGPADTVVPRLLAAEADLDAVHFWGSVLEGDREEPPSFPRDADLLSIAIRGCGAVLVIVDPLMAYLGGYINTWRDHDVRQALHPLARVAEETGAAILLIRHLTKGSAPAIYRGGGSIGIAAAARSVLLAARDPDDDSRRVLASVKSNLGPSPASLSYDVQGGLNGAARIVWGAVSPHGADTLVAMGDSEERAARDEAADFLREWLSGDGLDRRAVLTRAREAGFTERTIDRAAQRLGVMKSRSGFGPNLRSTWRLPSSSDAVPPFQTARTADAELARMGGPVGNGGSPHEAETDPDEAARVALREGA